MTRFCTSCGQPLVDGMRFCTNCGAPVPPPAYNEPQPQTQPQPEPTPEPRQTYTPQPEPQPTRPMMPKPKSHLALAILTTIFCCLPLGIVSIVQAAKVDNLWNNGQYDAAINASDKAKKWAVISAVLAIAIYIIYFVLAAKGIIDLEDL